MYLIQPPDWTKKDLSVYGQPKNSEQPYYWYENTDFVVSIAKPFISDSNHSPLPADVTCDCHRMDNEVFKLEASKLLKDYILQNALKPIERWILAKLEHTI